MACALRDFAGDTLASALLANGVRIVGRSLRLTGRAASMPAGPKSPMPSSTSPGDQRTIPSVTGDAGGAARRNAARGVNAGQACSPTSSLRSPLLAPLCRRASTTRPSFAELAGVRTHVRRLAGLGVAPTRPDPDRYEERHQSTVTCWWSAEDPQASPQRLPPREQAHAWCWRMIGRRSEALCSGRIKSSTSSQRLDWVASAESELRAAANARVLTRATAFGCYDHNLLALSERMAPGRGPTGYASGSGTCAQPRW